MLLTKRADTPLDVYPLRPLSACSPLPYNSPDQVIEHAENERQSASTSNEEDVLVCAEVERAPSTGTIQHDLHVPAATRNEQGGLIAV
jgi:hypothetical protein